MIKTKQKRSQGTLNKTFQYKKKLPCIWEKSICRLKRKNEIQKLTIGCRSNYNMQDTRNHLKEYIWGKVSLHDQYINENSLVIMQTKLIRGTLRSYTTEYDNLDHDSFCVSIAYKLKETLR